MINRLALISLVLSVHTGCKKDPEISADCPVIYQINLNKSYSIGGNWKFIGFQKEGLTYIDYPLCKGYEKGDNFEVTISFADTTHNYNDTVLYTLPYLFSGKAPINGYGGSYNFDDNTYNLTIGKLVSTKVGGPSVLSDYEDKYYDALHNAYRYKIDKNVLIVYYGTYDKMLFVAKD